MLPNLGREDRLDHNGLARLVTSICSYLGADDGTGEVDPLAVGPDGPDRAYSPCSAIQRTPRHARRPHRPWALSRYVQLGQTSRPSLLWSGCPLLTGESVRSSSVADT